MNPLAVLTFLLGAIAATSCGPTPAEQRHWQIVNEQMQMRIEAYQLLKRLRDEDRQADEDAREEMEELAQRRKAFHFSLTDAQVSRLSTAQANQNQESWQRFLAGLTAKQRDEFSEILGLLTSLEAAAGRNQERKTRISKLSAGLDSIQRSESRDESTDALIGIQEEIRKLRLGLPSP